MPTVSGTVTDRQGGSTPWSASWTVGSSVGMYGQPVGKVLTGMCTDDQAARVAETGPVGGEHFYVSSFSASQFISKAQGIHADGLFPYGCMKVGDWGAAATGAMDAQVDAFASQVAALGYPVRVTFHHEPGNNTPGGAGDAGTGFEWRDMLIRLLPRVKAVAPNAIVGPVDNGFKWSAQGQGWTDSELNQIYTDQLLAVCDALGADYYDGATTRTNGETAAVKVARAGQWADRRGWTGAMDIGEWNFVRPADCDAMWAVLKANPGRWQCANVFNSDLNNRANIPTIGGGWNFTHGYDTATDRLDAFKRILADPISSP